MTEAPGCRNAMFDKNFFACRGFKACPAIVQVSSINACNGRALQTRVEIGTPSGARVKQADKIDCRLAYDGGCEDCTDLARTNSIMVEEIINVVAA